MNIIGHCEVEMRWQIRLLHCVLMERLRANTPKRILGEVEKAIAIMEQTEVHMNQTLKTTAGMAWFDKNRIDIHYRLLRNKPDELEKTYAHEVGHIVAFLLFGERGHGKPWLVAMHYLGADNERCHSMDVSEFQRKEPARIAA